MAKTFTLAWHETAWFRWPLFLGIGAAVCTVASPLGIGWALILAGIAVAAAWGLDDAIYYARTGRRQPE